MESIPGLLKRLQTRAQLSYGLRWDNIAKRSYSMRRHRIVDKK
jgi:hypothetical protein